MTLKNVVQLGILEAQNEHMIHSMESWILLVKLPLTLLLGYTHMQSKDLVQSNLVYSVEDLFCGWSDPIIIAFIQR